MTLKPAPHHNVFYCKFRITAVLGTTTRNLKKIQCQVLFLGNHLNRAIVAVTSSTQTNFFLTVGGNSLDRFLAAAELTCTDFMFLHARLSPVFLGYVCCF